MVERDNELRVLNAAKRYAASDKSDPFVFARVLCHVAQGLCKFTADGQDGHYDAEERSAFDVDGVVTTHFTNIVRP